MYRKKIRVAATVAFVLLGAAAHASSDDAWKQFAADVEAKCRKAAAGSLENARAVVDPFGSEHYGLALLTGRPKGAKGTISFLCVYDKKTKVAEIGSELGKDTIDVRLPQKAGK